MGAYFSYPHQLPSFLRGSRSSGAISSFAPWRWYSRALEPISIDKRALIFSLCVVTISACGYSSEGSGGEDTEGDAGAGAVSQIGGSGSTDEGGGSTDDGSGSTDEGDGSTDDGSGSTDEGDGSTDEGDESGSSEAGSDPGPHPITVVNAGFESPETPPGSFEIGAPPDGWQPVGILNSGFRSIGVLNPATTANYAEAVPEGMNVGLVFLQDSFPDSAEAGMEQALSETLKLNSTYTLEVDVGNISGQPGGTYNFTGFPGYRIELLAGGAVIASDNGTLLPDEGRFELSSISVTTEDAHPDAGTQLAIRLMSLDGPDGIEVNFDDVRLTRTEP